MSTNYYLRAKPACDHCGRGPARGLHIGKSSTGWAFALHVYPDGEHLGEPAPRNLDEWIARFAEGVINEYGDDVSPELMLKIITERPVCHRHEPYPGHCIGPGAGTYDLLIGEFS